MGTTPPMFWVRVSQCVSADLFAYTGHNTLPVNKMSSLVILRVNINEIFNKTLTVNCLAYTDCMDYQENTD